MMNKPDFIVAGAAKSGTTSLFHWLNSHPDIFIPEIKECRYYSQLPNNFNGLGAEKFVNNGVRSPESYYALFENYKASICGDISNDYLYYHKESSEKILNELGPDVKIIIILRDPTTRAYSNYLHAYREGWEELTFEEAILHEPTRIKNNWAWPYHYVKTGFYSEQIQSYRDKFKNCLISLYDDLSNPEEFLKILVEFLGADNREALSTTRTYNSSTGLPKSKLLHRMIKNRESFLYRVSKPIRTHFPEGLKDRVRKSNWEKAPLNPTTATYLRSIYHDDITTLSGILGRDLSKWQNDEL